MKKEIRKDVREYILSQVNESLARLGVSEKVEEYNIYEDKYVDNLRYEFKSAPIRQMPMVFKELTVKGHMVSVEAKEGDYYYNAYKKRDIVVVVIDYNYKHFDMGTNGCKLGRMVFLVDRDLPEDFKSEFFDDVAKSYIYKAEGLSI